MAEQHIDILLVEDNVDHAAMIVQALGAGNFGASLCLARDGAEALGLLFGSNNSPDALPLSRPSLILLATKGARNLNALRYLKSNPHTCVIPVVLLGNQNEVRATEGYRMGANGFFHKPENAEAFGESIRSLCRYWLQINRPFP